MSGGQSGTSEPLPSLRQDFYAEIANDCADWLRSLAKKDSAFYQPLRVEIDRLLAWAVTECDREETRDTWRNMVLGNTKALDQQ